MELLKYQVSEEPKAWDSLKFLPGKRLTFPGQRTVKEGKNAASLVRSCEAGRKVSKPSTVIIIIAMIIIQ